MKFRNLPDTFDPSIFATLGAECRCVVEWHRQTTPAGNPSRNYRAKLRFDRRLDPQEKTRRFAAMSGRRTCGVTWSTHRRFLDSFFQAYPDATVETMIATYRGRDHFLSTFESTYRHNAGNPSHFVPFGSL